VDVVGGTFIMTGVQREESGREREESGSKELMNYALSSNTHQPD